MISSKKELKEWLDIERKQYGCKTGLNGLISYFAGNENAVIWHFQKRMRLTEYYLNTHKKLLYYQSLFRFNHLRNRYSMIIFLNTCEKGLRIMHLGPLLINKKARIGKGCALHINTAIVAHGVSDDAPIIGNGVVIGVGAVVLGGIRVADNVAIGANAVVNHDIDEENIAVAGAPTKKVSNNGRLNWNKADGKQ